MAEPTLPVKNPKRRSLSKEEIRGLLDEGDPNRVTQLYREADQIRKVCMGDEIHIRGVIEFSNYCRRNCLYCGLRKSNDQIVRYRMSWEGIFRAAQEAERLNFKTVVLQSGEDPYSSAEDLCSLIRKIRKNLNLAITLSIGERTYEEYERFRDAGADRYLLKMETFDPDLFKRLKPDSSYKERFRCLEWLKELGYQVGSGNIVGLPHQSVESLAGDILWFQKFDFDMIGIGPFIPHPNTPLGDTPRGDLDTVLKVVALTRLVTGNAHLPATTAVGTIHPWGRQKALSCGANVIMPNVTPREYRKYYEIYPNKICILDSPQNCRKCIEKMVMSLNRVIASDFGHTIKKRGSSGVLGFAN